MDKNVRPKYVKKKVIIDFGAFCSLIPKSGLFADLNYAFNERFHYQEKENEILKKGSKPKLKQKKNPKDKKGKKNLVIDSDDESPVVLERYNFSFEPKVLHESPKRKESLISVGKQKSTVKMPVNIIIS